MTVFDKAQQLAKQAKLEHQGAKARPTYKVGQEIVCTYTDAPIPPEHQYQPGQRVSIHHNNALVAWYEVVKSDDTTIKGVIVEVTEHYRKEVTPRHRHQTDRRRKEPT